MVIPDDVEIFMARRRKTGECGEALQLLEAAIIHDGSIPGPELLPVPWQEAAARSNACAWKSRHSNTTIATWSSRANMH